MSKVIQVEHLSKIYKLGAISTGNISHDFQRWMAKIRGKEDPYLKIGQQNNREAGGTGDVVYSLRDVSFAVNQGESIGIIGRNGAGKSTLLKVLSRITSPTAGTVKVKGRVASLLEVGTGFHPELSGRDNIYLNGSILGMRKKEIDRKLAEIIEFSGVERYIDTPVKRYSSGMYVRLAFAVAAHLEPEILIVDEVLAVGDAEFQKKCLGKMNQVSTTEGRTILFVSHNLSAVETLCTRAIYMDMGSILSVGHTTDIIKEYVARSVMSRRNLDFDSAGKNIGNDNITILQASVENATAPDPDEVIDISSDIHVKLRIINHTKDDLISVGFDLKTAKGDVLFGSGGKFLCPKEVPTTLSCKIPANFLNNDIYQVNTYFHSAEMTKLFSIPEILTFEVKDVTRETGYLGKINGLIRTNLEWQTIT